MRFIISGGGSGGHIFPAIAIANALRRKQPDADILFVGLDGLGGFESGSAQGRYLRCLRGVLRYPFTTFFLS